LFGATPAPAPPQDPAPELAEPHQTPCTWAVADLPPGLGARAPPTVAAPVEPPSAPQEITWQWRLGRRAGAGVGGWRRRRGVGCVLSVLFSSPNRPSQ